MFRRAGSGMTSRRGDRSTARCPPRSSGTSRPMASTFNKLKTGRTTPLQLARLLRGAAVDKKAWDAVVIDVRDKTSIADYFVVCEGETDRQVRAIADGMVEAARSASSDLWRWTAMTTPPGSCSTSTPCWPTYSCLANARI